MKKLLVVLILSILMLSGCGIFRSKHAWKQAKQENPLQIPPSLDRPSTTAALTIPPPGNTQAASATQSAATQPKASMANPTRMHLPGDVATAYKRVGLALQHGDLGTVSAQDAASHTYQLSFSNAPDLGSSQSFMQKHFSNLNQSGQSDSSSSDLGKSQGTTTVMLKVAPAKNGGSIVSAQGDPQQAVHVISVLRGRLGG